MDEVALYGRALSAFEIQTIYEASFGGKCPIPPAITAQPGNQIGTVGGQAVFTAGTTGSQPMAYQWYFNGTNIGGATGPSLILSSLTTNQAGNYSLSISNAAGGPVFSSNATLTVNPAPPCYPAPSNIVSWWSAQSNALDNFGLNNGTPENSPTYAPGEVGTAFNFNGNRQCILVPDSPSLHLTNALTIEAWVYPTQAGSPNSYSIVVKYDGIGGVNQSAYGFSINQNSTIYLIVSRDGVPSHNAQINSVHTVPINSWTHVAATYDGSAMKLYINGALDATLAYTNGIFPGMDNMAIGANVGGLNPTQGAGPFVGNIDEVSIYNRALSSGEIQSIYSIGTAGKCPMPPVFTAQPTNQTAPLLGNAAFSAVVTGFKPLFYQWYFNGTNINHATNSTLTLTNLQFSQAGSYSVLVSNSAGITLSSNAMLVVNPLFNFAWNHVASPQIVGVPFMVTIQAKNPTNNQVATNFTGTVALQTTNGVPVSPAVSGNFTAGIWTGSLTIAQAVPNLDLKSADSYGETAFANPINVIVQPALFTATSGETLYLSWPTNAPSFMLETSPDLSPGSWAPIGVPPLRIGDQFVESIIFSPTNAFYRLRYTGQ
jgi:hypothetical protein